MARSVFASPRAAPIAATGVRLVQAAEPLHQAPPRTGGGLRLSSFARAVRKERIASASSTFSEFLNEIMPFSASAPSTTMDLNKSGALSATV